MPSDNEKGCLILGGGGTLAALVIGGVCLGMWGCPQYHVYEQRMAGEAKLRESESSRQVLIQEAHAKMEASKMLAEAEVERAKGVARANEIIGEGLRGHHEYLMYLWIQSLGDKDNHVVYVPTEGQLPILEASRFMAPVKGADAKPKEQPKEQPKGK